MTLSEIYENEELFKELIENISSGVGIYETTDEGETFTVREMNKAGLRICEVKREEIVGHNVLDLFPNAEDFGFIEILRRVWKTGRPERSSTAFYQNKRVNGLTKMYIYRLSSEKVVMIFDRQSEIIEAQESLNRKKIEEELEKSEYEKATILQSLQEHIVYQSLDNTIIWVNTAAADSIDINPEKLIGRKCFQVWNNRNTPCKGCPVRKSIKTKKPEIKDMETQDGRKWRVAGYPVKDRENKIIGVVESTLDITEKKMAEEKAEERTRVLTALNKIIIFGNETTTLQEFLEKSFEQVLEIISYDRGIIYLYNLETHQNILFLHLNEHSSFLTLIKDLNISKDLFNKVFDMKKLLFIEDFSEFIEDSKELGVYSTVIVPLHSKDQYVGSMMISSPNHQILSQSQLDSLMSIGKQMGLIIQKFESEKLLKESEEKYRKSYYQANLYRDIFAHDINNILQNIHSSAELSSLYLNNPEKLSTISELYEIIHEQVDRGRKLIENVRKINEIENEEIDIKKVEIFRILNYAIEFLKNSFQARNLSIKLNFQEKKAYVYANNLLLDAFDNILINAVRHNSSTKIEIAIEIKKEKIKKENYIRMEFSDNGIGISDSRKKSIFEKGSRKSRRSRGLGLGLSLVKKIIDSYQGDIWVEDRIEGDYRQGSKFIVLLHEHLG